MRLNGGTDMIEEQASGVTLERRCPYIDHEFRRNVILGKRSKGGHRYSNQTIWIATPDSRMQGNQSLPVSADFETFYNVRDTNISQTFM